MKVDARGALDAFRRYLSERNLPATSQRLAVATVVLDAADHVSAEDVAQRVARQGTGVGLATVYRTLDLLVASGLVAERDFGEGFHRYEPVSPGQVHQHCICTSCGRVREFANDRLERMIALLAEEVEFRPHHHHLEVFGLCRDCQQTNPLTRTQ
jgi:Fur family transcriptional regulator, ferric uptake regulator